MPVISIDVVPPVGGISRRLMYQKQPPFTSYDSLNYWPIDVKTGRVTSSTRPALNLFGTLQTPVSLLAQVNGAVSGKPAQSFVAAYDGTLFWWNGTTMVTATGSRATSIDTDRMVSAAPVVNQLVIAKSGASEPPLVFDYAAGTVESIVATAGVVPLDTTIAVNWQGAVWVVIGRVLYASRVGDITDWDFSVPLEDQFGAFFTDGDYKGILAGPITAVMPQSSDAMIVSTVSGTLAMRGHPRQGGVFEPVGSPYALGQGAWCLSPDSRLFMLTKVGLMSLDPTPGAIMAQVSRDKIPDELMGILFDPSDPLITLAYDTRWNGIHIYVRGLQEQGWWFDIENGGFHRIQIPAYPQAIVEFNEFITESTSGVLLGGYDGVKFFDRFATESINSSLVVGPVVISKSPNFVSKIQSLRATFSRDTPNATGTLKVAAGLDGQDAVSRLLSGQHQYEIPLTSLELGNGICYPAVAGHSVVMAVSADTGDVGIEQITLDVVPMGRATYSRIPQLSADGEPTEFSGGFIDLDPAEWVGYTEVTPMVNPDENLPTYTHFLDLSLMPNDWWIQVRRGDGSDIRVSTDTNGEVPTTLADFDLINKLGMLMFNISQTTIASAVRVWVGRDGAVVPSKTSAYGQYNVFDVNWRGFWYDGGGDSNLTQYTTSDSATHNRAGNVGDALQYGTEAGPLGAKATDFEQGTGTHWGIEDWAVDNGLTGVITWTLLAVFKRTSPISIGLGYMAWIGNNFSISGGYHLRGVTTSGNARAVFTNKDASSATSGIGGVALDNWRHFSGKEITNSDRSAFIDGTQEIQNTTSGTTGILSFSCGTNGHLTQEGQELRGHLALVQVHDVARSDAWIKYQGEMIDQVTFWGTIGAFTLVNVIPTPVLDIDACPIGEEPVAEVGTTAGYDSALPTNPVDGTVSDFTHLIDLSAMSATWWTTVKAAGIAGQDIRVTDAINSIHPSDLIEYDEIAETGLLAFNALQTEGAPSVVRVWCGNAAAVAVPKCGAYGQYNTYDSAWRGFYPDGGGDDRSQYINTLTVTGAPTQEVAQSPVGTVATLFSNPSNTSMAAAEYYRGGNKVSATGPYTITASVRRPSGSIHDDAVLANVGSSVSSSAVILHTRPSTTPARVSTRNSYGSEGTSGNSLAVTPTSDWFQGGYTFGNYTRKVVVDAGGTSSNPQTAILVSDLDQITIAADPGTAPVRGFSGFVSLVGVHTEVRGDAWMSYWNKSLDQSTFWSVWAWTADPTALS